MDSEFVANRENAYDSLLYHKTSIQSMHGQGSEWEMKAEEKKLSSECMRMKSDCCVAERKVPVSADCDLNPECFYPRSLHNIYPTLS